MAAPRNKKINQQIEVEKTALAIDPSTKKKILVVGGGTGLTTAFMLESMPNFEVTLLEAGMRLGGHIDSIDCGDHGMAEGGAEFIGSLESYPNFHKLAAMLEVELQSYQLNVDFSQIIAGKHTSSIVLPPVYHSTLQPEESPGCWAKLFGSKNKHQTKNRFDISTILNKFTDLLGLQASILNAKSKPAPERLEDVRTLEEFIQDFKFYTPDLVNREIDAFAQNVLYPMVAAAWGIPISEAKQMCAHYALNYISLGSDGWFDAPAGLSSYINKLERFSEHLNIELDTQVVEVIPLNEGGYHVKVKAGTGEPTLFLDNNGVAAVFDEVVFSTSAYSTQAMLPNIEASDMLKLKEALEAVKYYDTTLVFHTDKAYETPKQTVIYTRVEGDIAANTAQKDWKAKNGAIPVMKTWVLADQAKPKESKILHERHYRHPYMDKAYFAAQLMLQQMQDKYSLHFGGILGGNGDSHEDAITAALKIARTICKKYHCLHLNNRLQPFLNENGKISEKNTQLSSPALTRNRQSSLALAP